jgi:Tfp pilus assembly protein PilE
MARFLERKETEMDLMIVPVILALLLTAYVIYRGYAARARGRRTPDQEQ